MTKSHTKFKKLCSLILTFIMVFATVQVNIGFTAAASPATKYTAANPYLPLWEHLPDGEPKVFKDPDNPGKYRAYIIGSHDVSVDGYCGPDIRVWSAPVEDLSNWIDEGPIFTFQDPQTGDWDTMFAPDLIELERFPAEVENGTVPRTPETKRTVTEYYLYPHSRGPGREAMVAKGSRPDGPFVPINLNANGRTLVSGSVVGFDPSIYVEYIDDPSDPDYNIGFRAYGYWGFQRSIAAELDQKTMYSRRTGGAYYSYFMPASDGYGQAPRDPAGTQYPAIFPGEDLTSFNFFEASSIRKVDNKYVMVYSGHSGPDYGMGSTNSALRYCYGDSPLGPWKAGGVLVDSRGPVLNQNGTGLVGRTWGHNTHGSILLINDQWYAFYHRPPRGNMGSRQPVVAPITITYDQASVADGGKLTIRACDTYAENGIWTAKDSQGREYTGAEITSEGFQIYGMAPYEFYSAGYASYLSSGNTMQDSRDIWDNHMPITNVANGHQIGFKYFGFGGLDVAKKGLKPFEGTKPGNNTKFNMWLTPITDNAFKVNVWLDGPWDNATWKGTKIGEINVPAGAAKESTRFSIDVSQYVDNLDKKHAIFLVAEGGSGSLFNFTGLGFSSDKHEIERIEPPTVNIFADGNAITLPANPVKSTPSNGIVDLDLYETNVVLPRRTTKIPTLTATSSDPEVGITIIQPTTVFGTAEVKFDYNGVVKTYRVKFEQETLPAIDLTATPITRGANDHSSKTAQGAVGRTVVNGHPYIAALFGTAAWGGSTSYSFSNNSANDYRAAFDGVTTGDGHFDGRDRDGLAGVEFITPQVVNRVGSIARLSASRLNGCTFEGSQDGEEYTKLYTFAGASTSAMVYADINNTVAYKYYRVKGVSGLDGSAFNPYELKFYNVPKYYEVKFMVDGDVYENIDVIQDGKVVRPDNPIKEGYDFVGWFDEDGVEFDFDALITANMTITAKFVDVTPTGLVAWYKLNESGAETIAKDSSGNNNDASVVGAAKWDANGGFMFSGGPSSSGNAIKIPDNILAGLDDVSVTFDIYVEPHNLNNMGAFTLGNQTAAAGYLSFRPTNGTTAAAANGSNNTLWAQFANNSSTYTAQKNSGWLQRKVWKSVAITLKGGETGNAGQMSIYEDGVSAATVANIVRKPPAASTYNYIGRSYSSANPSFKGTIRNFRIYGKELNPQEVAALADPIVSAGIAMDAKAIDLGNISAVAANLTLPVTGDNSTTITWATSDASVITASGVITRPASGSATADLTATISRGGKSETKVFPITVMAVGDAADAAWDAGMISLVNPDDVRGNILLPTQGEAGSTISWVSSNPNIVTSTGEVTRPAYGETAVTVDLTATATKGSASATYAVTLTVQPMPRKMPFRAYAQSSFKDNNLEGEKMYMLVSNGNNALSWSAVNGYNPVLESYKGTLGIRDPFIIRSHEGDKFYMIATDMSYARFGNWTAPSRQGSPYLVVFESEDLVNWSDQRLIRVAPKYPDVGNSWAPEAIYDEERGEYVVYWASKFYDPETDPNHEGPSNNRMLLATTRDFVNFSEPIVWYYEPGFNRIDVAVIKEGDTWYRFVKDDADSTPTGSPDTTQDIFVEKHTDLRATPYTEWTKVSEELGRKSMGGARFGTGYEGPIVFKANPGDVNGDDFYYLFLDRYKGSALGYYAGVSSDLEAQVWTSKTVTRPAGRTAHGSMITLTQPEADKLIGLETAAVTSTTALSFAANDSVSINAIATVTASDGGQVAGDVVFSLGSWSGTARLNEDGVATIAVPVGSLTLNGSEQIKAVYQGYGVVAGSEIEAALPLLSLSLSATMSEADGIASVVADVYSGDSALSAKVIAAAYSLDGKLIAVSEKALDLPKTSREQVSLSLDVSKAGAGYKVKVFMWDKDTLVPLVKAFAF